MASPINHHRHTDAATVIETPSTPTTPWHATWVGKGLFFIAVIFVLQAAQPLLVPIAVAIVLTFVLATPVRMLRRYGVPEVVGAAILVGALLGSSTLVISMFVGPATQWWERAPFTLVQIMDKLDQLRSTIPGLAPPPPPPPASAPAPGTRAARNAPAAPAAPAPPPADPIRDKIASEGLALTGAVLGRSLSFTISALATVILLYFLLASEHWMLSRTVEAIPRRRTRALVLARVRSAQREIGHYLAAVGIINACVGVATGLAIAYLGLPNPVMWGTVAAVLNFIPYIGPMMVVALLLLAGFLTFGTAGAVMAPPVAFLLIHAVESNFVTPWFVGRRLTLSPISVFISVMFWGWMWGIAGALIAVPMLVGLRSFCKRNRRLRLIGAFLEGDHKEPPSLRSLVRVRRRTVLVSQPAPSPGWMSRGARRVTAVAPPIASVAEPEGPASATVSVATVAPSTTTTAASTDTPVTVGLPDVPATSTAPVDAAEPR